MGELYSVATSVAAYGALIRAVAVLLLSVRTFLARSRFVSVQFDRGFFLSAPEPFLMLGLGVLMATSIDKPADPGTGAVIAAVAGALLVLTGWAVALWTFASWPAIFVGHALLAEHRLVTNGAYGVVRHPVYLGAFLIWLGLGVAFESPLVLAVTILYVIPAYLVYMRDEEIMLGQAFGDTYARYRATVPMLVPRFAHRRLDVDTSALHR